MPLAREQRDTLAEILRWSRANGWKRDVYPHAWRSADGVTHVRYDAVDGELVVGHMTADPLRYRVALVPIGTLDVAVNVLAAVGCIPAELSPMGQRLLGGQDPDPVPAANDPDAFDGPASFIEAGQAFADWVDGRVTAESAADVLSKLAREGLIISVAYHDERTGGPADLMADLAEIFGDDL